MQRRAHPWDRFYRYHRAPWRGERDLAPLLPWLGDGPILELGCGNGKTLVPLWRQRGDTVGLDVSWHALRRLGHGPRILADAVHLPLAAGTLTAVLDLHCTGHLAGDDRRRALAEARRVLAPGGHLVVERLHPDDMRMSAGAEVVEPGTVCLQDGRMTHASDEGDLRSEAPEFTLVQAHVDRFQQRVRGGWAARAILHAVLRRH